MEPILDETSLLPCATRSPSDRISELARTLTALDAHGAPRVLRSVRDAVDRDIAGGFGLRKWCFDRGTQKDAGRLIAGRLASQPFIDGTDGLFAALEGQRAIEAKVNGAISFGAGLAALTDGIVVLLASAARPVAERLEVELTYVDEVQEHTERIEIQTFATDAEIRNVGEELARRLDGAVQSGREIVARIGELFPSLVLGDQAREQIEAQTGSAPVFRQLVRHLRALEEGARRWKADQPFEPVSVTYSVESQATLNDGKFGPMRDFPTPHGFEAERWTLHTKLTGGAGARLYFRAVRSSERTCVLVGYFGDHLPTVKYKT